MENQVDIHFPLYRKYPNNKSYFKVLSVDAFEEVQVIGKNYVLSELKAKILPERNLIHDIIATEGHWVEIEAEEFEKVKKIALG